MCEYCDSKRPKRLFLSEDDGNGFNVSIYIHEQEKNYDAEMYVSVDYNGNELGVDLTEKIHYCPMCGRKLSE